MKILVCLKEVIDPALALDFGLDNPVLFREGLPLRLDPASATALQKALELKAAVEDPEIMAVSVGPERVEGYLRDALALGADRVMRIQDEGPDTPRRKAILLAGAAARWGADIIFTGARSLDTGNGQVAGLIAAYLGFPGVSEAISIEPGPAGRITLVRDIGRGKREKVRCPIPAVVAFKGAGKLPYATLDMLIESRQAPIEQLTAADLGISSFEFNEEPTRLSGLVFPHPRLRKAPPLDSSLPAFERILQLLEGGISRRRGVMLTGDIDTMVEHLFEQLKEAGALKPAGR